ncbi:Phosphatidylinositol/phosphatidylcholine transfer protein SFH3 [Zea mays]|uniref:Phosphatidylinositol/phosphatidylcholine transfer protein SFH3 n=1 Tax=Zea mays TaxID=4577 RepID=A0A3L6DP30_MAIZE|nr:Phosphatidylinositol/phosphatidylcholine transfer protein SFH3 [Zea mays]
MMLRFLKARKFEADKAMLMWSEMLKWMKEFGTDTILELLMVDGNGLLHARGMCSDESDIYTRFNSAIKSIGDVLLAILLPLFSQVGQKRGRLLADLEEDEQPKKKGFKNFSKTARELVHRMQKIDSDYYLEVLGSNYQSRLLEVIDSSELPEFLGGSCTCSDKGGCLGSNKGPWNDRYILKLIHNLEAGCAREIKPISEGEERNSSSFRLEQMKWQGLLSDTSNAESGSDVDDFGASFVQFMRK